MLFTRMARLAAAALMAVSASLAAVSAQAEATLTFPDAVNIGEEFQVVFTGPGGSEDWIDIITIGNDSDFSGGWSWAWARGDRATLTAPAEPGEYLLRYVADPPDASPVALTSSVLTVRLEAGERAVSAQAEATLAFPDTVNIGEEFQVVFTGPGAADDWIDIITIGNDGDFSGGWSWAGAQGDRVTLTAPAEPGVYLLRYVADPPDAAPMALASAILTVRFEGAERCAVLARWASTADEHTSADRNTLWPAADRVLPGALTTNTAAELLGLSGTTVDVGLDDLARLRDLVSSCERYAGNDIERAQFRRAIELHDAARRFIQAHAGFRERVSGAFARLEAQPAEASILRFLVQLEANATAGREARPELVRLAQLLPAPLRAGGLVEVDLVGAWGGITAGDLENDYGPRIRRMIVEGRTALAERFAARLAETSGVEGLTGIAELARIESDPDLALLDGSAQETLLAEIASRRGIMVEQLTQALYVRLAAIPSGASPWWDLEALRTDPLLAAIQPSLAAEFLQALQRRTEELAESASTAILAVLANLPPTLDGLEEGLWLHDQHIVALRRHVSDKVEAAYRATAVARLTSMAQAGLDVHAGLLAALPPDEMTLAALADERQRIADWPLRDPDEHPDLRSALIAYHTAVEAREAEIVAAIQAAEAGPVAGRSYELMQGYADGIRRIEFLDASRALVSFSDGSTDLVGYEEITGERIALSVSGRNLVLSRDGRRLAGGPFSFVRIAQ